MLLARRDLLARTGAALAAGTIATSEGWNQAVAQTAPQAPDEPSLDTWDGVRAQFALSDEYVHLSAMLIAAGRAQGCSALLGGTEPACTDQKQVPENADHERKREGCA